MTNQTEKKPTIYGYILFSVIFLFNPNISVIDILPDFIAYFVLARAFSLASDCAPHFEEARVSFKRLGWLNFFKFFGLLVMLLVRRQNSSDNDIIPLVTLVFSLCEVVLMFIAIKNIFNALFYLGNRSDCLSTITPFEISGRKVRPETVRTLSFFFAAFKCFAYFVPTPFLLTTVNMTAAGRAKLAKWFISVLISSQIIGIIVGIVWLIFIRKYALAIKNEEKFFPTLEALLKNNKDFSLEKTQKLRSIMFSLSVFSVASLFTLELALVENYDVNIIPHFIYAAILLFGVYKLSQFADGKRSAYISGAAYLVISIATYIVQSYFLIEYGYEGLLTTKAAKSFYPAVIALSVIEFLSLTAFLLCIYKMLKSFILKNTGINENSADLKSNEGYYGSLLKKNTLFTVAGIAVGLVKLISVILHGLAKRIYSSTGDELKNSIISPAVEWIGLLVTVFAFIYIGITLYFISTLKDEVKMKYERV